MENWEKEESHHVNDAITYLKNQEITEQAHVICKEAGKKGLKNYWEWVMGILIQCGLYLLQTTVDV